MLRGEFDSGDNVVVDIEDGKIKLRKGQTDALLTEGDAASDAVEAETPEGAAAGSESSAAG